MTTPVSRAILSLLCFLIKRQLLGQCDNIMEIYQIAYVNCVLPDCCVINATITLIKIIITAIYVMHWGSAQDFMGYHDYITRIFAHIDDTPDSPKLFKWWLCKIHLFFPGLWIDNISINKCYSIQSYIYRHTDVPVPDACHCRVLMAGIINVLSEINSPVIKVIIRDKPRYI